MLLTLRLDLSLYFVKFLKFYKKYSSSSFLTKNVAFERLFLNQILGIFQI